MKSNSGVSTISILLVIVLVAAAAIGYITFTQKKSTTPITIQEIQTQGTSTETSAIESDLNATSFTSIDSDLSDIETELNAALSE